MDVTEHFSIGTPDIKPGDTSRYSTANSTKTNNSNSTTNMMTVNSNPVHNQLFSLVVDDYHPVPPSVVKKLEMLAVQGSLSHPDEDPNLTTDQLSANELMKQLRDSKVYNRLFHDLPPPTPAGPPPFSMEDELLESIVSQNGYCNIDGEMSSDTDSHNSCEMEGNNNYDAVSSDDIHKKTDFVNSLSHGKSEF